MRQIIQKINAYFDGRGPGDSGIHYVLDKRVAGPWNIVLARNISTIKIGKLEAKLVHSESVHNSYSILTIVCRDFGDVSETMILNTLY
jgi:hypothetical protein